MRNHDWLRGTNEETSTTTRAVVRNAEGRISTEAWGLGSWATGIEGIARSTTPPRPRQNDQQHTRRQNQHIQFRQLTDTNVCLHVFHPEHDAEAPAGPPPRAARQETRTSERGCIAKPPGRAHSRACARAAAVRRRVEADEGLLRCRPGGERGEMPRKSALLATVGIKSSCAALLQETLTLRPTLCSSSARKKKMWRDQK